MAVHWTPYVWPHALPLEPDRLRAAEQRLGVRFPQDYVDCVLQHQGQTPEPATFRYGEGGSTVFNELYHFEDSPATSSQRAAQESLETAGLPAGLVPFAGDPAGNHMCFDFREHAQTPTVVMLDHDAAGEDMLKSVAASFSELLEKLA